MSEISREESLTEEVNEKKQLDSHVNTYNSSSDEFPPDYKTTAIGKDGFPDAESGEITADTSLETTLQLVTKTLDASVCVIS